MDVLPSMSGFATTLAKESTAAATTAGRSAGKAWASSLGQGATGGAALVADLEKASRASASVVSKLAGQISQARAAERTAAAGVIAAEQRLTDAREKYGDISSQAQVAELKLEAAREKASGATTRYKAAEDQLRAAQREHREITGQLETATKNLTTEVTKAPSKWDELKASLSSSGDAADTTKSQIGDLAAGLGSAVGAAELFSEGWSQALELDSGVARVTAALDLTSAQSERAGEVAGDLYSAAWGDSLGGTTAAVEAVISSIDGMSAASAPELEHATELALAFSDVFEQDVSEAARNAGILIKTGLATDATDAFDLMTGALQQVPTAMRGEAMDALQEYSAFFAALGMDGPEAVNAITFATENGQYGIDKMGDALKEFSIRAASLDDTGAQDALAAIGLSGTDMANQLLAGGDTAGEAMSQIVDGLLGIQDPGEQAAAAIALFGTPLEDLGLDKIPGFLASLSSSTAEVGEFTGAADDLATTVGGATSTSLETVTRGFQDALRDGIEPLLEPANAVLTWAKEIPGGFTAVAAGIGTLAVGVGAYTVVQWAMNSALLASPITWVIVGIAALVAAIVLLVANWDTVVAWIDDVWTAAVDWVKESFASVGEWFTTKGEEISAFLTGLWTAITTSITLAWTLIRVWFEGLWEDVTGAFTRAWDFIKDLLSWTPIGMIVENWDAILGFFSDMPGRISAAVSGLWDGLTSSFKEAVNSIIRGWNDLRFTIGGGEVMGRTLPSFTLDTPNIPLLARGGTATAPGWSVVGEMGPELLHLPVGAQVVPLSRASSSTTKVVGAEYSGTVYVVDPEAFARRQAARTRDALVAHTGVVG
jgi:phage-related minor tail protein